MKRRLKVKITTIRQQTVEVGERGHLLCPICGYRVDPMTSADAVQIIGVSNAELDDGIEKPSATVFAAGKSRKDF
jgi:hypothetical protein